MSDSVGPLHDVVVLDLGQIYMAPYATLLMALAGARVVKVEPPQGENLRSRGKVPGAGGPFAMLNSNKQAVTLNLKHPDGRQLLERMASKVDVLVENFRPGVMARLGITAERLRASNRGLIYASGSGFGSTGPYKDYPAMDLTIQAISGVMSVTGFPDRGPVKTGPAVADFLGGIHLYAGVVTALYERERTGIGTDVEVAMFDAVYPSLMSSLGSLSSVGDAIPSRTANRHSGLAESPYNVYPARDGYVALICVTEGHWEALVAAMERTDLAERRDLATRAGRVAKMDEVDEIVAGWTADLPKEEIVGRLRGFGVPCAPVREIEEVIHDPHLLERGMISHIDHPQHGPLTVPHSPLRVGDFRAELTPSPALGQDNEAVYGSWLGLGTEEISELSDRGAI